MSTEDLAAALLSARAEATLIDPPSSTRPAFDLEQGYAVGAAIVAARRAAGERTVGRKIGFTNAAIWEQYGVDGPLWAHMYAGGILAAPDGQAAFSLNATVAPQIEPELVLGLAAPVSEGMSQSALLHAIAWVAVGFEIVDCHYADWRFTLADAVADFGLHTALIIGPQIPLLHDQPDAQLEALSRCSLTLRCNDQLIATGMGANALGSPVRALDHLLRTLRNQSAEPLAAGEIVTTGTLTPAFPISPGQTWSASLRGLSADPLILHLRLH